MEKRPIYPFFQCILYIYTLSQNVTLWGNSKYSYFSVTEVGQIMTYIHSYQRLHQMLDPQFQTSFLSRPLDTPVLHMQQNDHLCHVQKSQQHGLVIVSIWGMVVALEGALRIGEEDSQVWDTRILSWEDRKTTWNSNVSSPYAQPSGLPEFVVNSSRGSRSRPREPI